MSKQQIQTDNSFIEEKVNLRLESLEHIDKETIHILECFGGEGVIWGKVKEKSSKTIKVLRIDLKHDKQGIYLHGNNLKFLQNFDLSNFDIIDLDAYGSPFPQLEIIFKKCYSGIIHCTFIQAGMGMLNYDLLRAVGFSKTMVKKCPTLFSKAGIDKLYQYLCLKGVKKLSIISIERKHYFWFHLPK